MSHDTSYILGFFLARMCLLPLLVLFTGGARIGRHVRPGGDSHGQRQGKAKLGEKQGHHTVRTGDAVAVFSILSRQREMKQSPPKCRKPARGTCTCQPTFVDRGKSRSLYRFSAHVCRTLTDRRVFASRQVPLTKGVRQPLASTTRKT